MRVVAEEDILPLFWFLRAWKTAAYEGLLTVEKWRGWKCRGPANVELSLQRKEEKRMRGRRRKDGINRLIKKALERDSKTQEGPFEHRTLCLEWGKISHVGWG